MIEEMSERRACCGPLLHALTQDSVGLIYTTQLRYRFRVAYISVRFYSTKGQTSIFKLSKKSSITKLYHWRHNSLFD